ncbi:hypothetical protein, partial [Bartonella sp. CL63NXGY]|uniref:hypothetical protein n=1 Tax=Bartonella sp. CL63NXGY TaxID=3243538 RepID=UPI0035D00C01
MPTLNTLNGTKKMPDKAITQDVHGILHYTTDAVTNQSKITGLDLKTPDNGMPALTQSDMPTFPGYSLDMDGIVGFNYQAKNNLVARSHDYLLHDVQESLKNNFGLMTD